MSRLAALLWDVDGTLAETERDGHRVAFNLAFADFGLPWRWSEHDYGALLAVNGGRQRLLRYMADRADAPTLHDERQALATRLHGRKNKHYGELVRGGAITLRPGVRELLDAARGAGLRLAVTTTTSRVNLEVLLGARIGPQWRTLFDVTVCAAEAGADKPDPAIYLRALKLLQLPALACLAIEDSPGGVASARAADVPVMVTRSHYFARATIDGAVAIGPGLHTRAGWTPALLPATPDRPVELDDLRQWHAAMDLVSQFG
jgi:HAD superfamily hydrolase (TIGR01509 family)